MVVERKGATACGAKAPCMLCKTVNWCASAAYLFFACQHRLAPPALYAFACPVLQMFFYNQAHVAKHFGMGTTRFKPVLRGLGVRYWPQR